MDGSNLDNQPGVYGTPGVPALANNPGARQGSATWKDGQGNLWLFGGYGYDRDGTLGWLADLWKYDVTTGRWTWVNGTNVVNTTAEYGSKGVASAANRPEARSRAVSWTDSTGRFWLFGGDGFTDSGASTGLNDLWMYDPSTGNPSSGKWTWMHGTSLRNDRGSYGAFGVANPSNIPPNRAGAVSWVDASGNLWLFGGAQVPVSGGSGNPKLNDLWKYDIATNRWTWMKGANTGDAAGVYDGMGFETSDYRPGSRSNGHGWTDAQGRLWLFGGYGFTTSVATAGWLNDLWRYDPKTNNWAWMKGTNLLNQNGNYGLLVDPNPNNRPGGLESAMTWRDAQGDFWLYGGVGYTTGGDRGELSALWRYKVASNVWTWMNGSHQIDDPPVYGTRGIHNPSNVNTPGGLRAAAAWVATPNRLWLFGGKHADTYSQTLWQLAEIYGITLTSGGATIANNGTAAIGTSVIGTGVTRTFTILNSGLTGVSGLNVAVQNAQNGAFAVTQQPASTLAPGASTTFAVTFTADSATTAARATIRIDGSGLPADFYINATGTGVLPTVTVALNPDWVWEDGTAFLEYTFTRSGGLATPLTVNFSVSGTATFDTDYFASNADNFSASAGWVTIPSGSASATIEIIPISDTAAEIEEYVQLNLVASAQYHVGAANLAVGAIASEELLPGGRDRTFLPEIAGNYVAATAVQPDGKLIIGGAFTTVNGVARTNLARLHPDGTLDASFGAAIHQDFPVTGVLMQPDGRIVVGGGGAGVARFLPDGSVDPTFVSPPSLSAFTSVAQQPDGKLLIGGNFTTVGGETRNRIARLHPDGTLDTTFDPGLGANDWVGCVAVQPDGQILVGGQFTTFAGQPRNCIVRLNADGSLDPAFDPDSGATGTAFPAVLSLVLQPDGRILVGGDFTLFNGQGRANLARLLSDGSLDPAFNAAAGTDGAIQALALQTDGRILLGGYFSNANNQYSPSLARLQADGAFDSTFQVSWGPSNGLYGITLLADGQILAAGNYTSINGAHSLLSRRANDPATQTLAPASGSVAQWQRAGAGPELARVTFDLSADGGANWMPLGDGIRSGTGWEIGGQAFPINGQLRARGVTAGSYLSAASSLIEQVASFSRAPEIAVEIEPFIFIDGLIQSGVPLVDGESNVDFGPRQYPAPRIIIPGGGSLGYLLLVRNVGNDDITGFSFSVDGDHPADFSASGTATFPPSDTIAPGTWKAVNIGFSPTALGTRNAALHIHTSDADEASFDIALTGFGATRREVWRHTHFGNIASIGDGADDADPDGDGNDNTLEFLAGKDPKDPNARFQLRIEAVEGQPAQRKILFTGPAAYVVGTALHFPTIAVQYRTSLTEGDWQPLGAPITWEFPEWWAIDTDAGGPAKFYRVKLTDP